MKRRFVLMSLVVVSALTARGMAQEPASNNQRSKKRLEMQLEYETARVKLFEEQVKLLKDLQETETEEALANNAGRNLEKNVLAARVKGSAAAVEYPKANLDRVKRLYERSAISQAEYDEARQNVTRSEAAQLEALAAVEQKQQEITAAELTLKRRQIQSLLQISEAKLKLLEAELRVRELKLQLGDSE